MHRGIMDRLHLIGGEQLHWRIGVRDMARRQLRDRRSPFMGAVGGTAAAGFGVHVFGIRQTGGPSIANPSPTGEILGCASDRKDRSRNNGKKCRIINMRDASTFTFP
jgi:hypothetical protein